MPIPSRLAIAILLMLFTATPASAGEKLTFGYIGDLLSYGSLAVLREAYLQLDITIETVQLPPGRSLTEADNGMTDGEIHRIKDIGAAHPNLLRVDFPVNQLQGVMLALDDLPITDINDLATYRVGIKTGLLYTEKLTRGLPNVIKLSHSDKLLTSLLQRRVDVVITDRLWAEMQIAHNPETELRIVGEPLVVIPLYHYINIRHADQAPKLVGILKTMEHNGLSDRIRQKAYREYERQGSI